MDRPRRAAKRHGIGKEKGKRKKGENGDVDLRTGIDERRCADQNRPHKNHGD